MGKPLERLTAALGQVVSGQERVISQLACAFLARGHVLLEGVPGVAKTLLAKTLAQALGLKARRVQFTPDLMPSDILGTNVFRPQEGSFHLVEGPIFTELLVADEINRTPPKTQAALLEAMEERQVTLDGTTRALAPSFFAVATQNPLDLEGTYPLPEAQLDRFLMRIRIGYPDADAERAMLTAFHGRGGTAPTTSAVVSRDELARLQADAAAIRCDPSILDYVVSLVRATRLDSRLRLGASPRSAQALLAASKAHAALNGATFVVPDDVKACCGSVLNHRLSLTAEAEVEGLTADDVIARTLERVAVPPMSRLGRPVPTSLFVALVALGLFPAAMVLVDPIFVRWVLAYDGLVTALALIDFALAPPPGSVALERKVEAVMSSGPWISIPLEVTWKGRGTLRGELRDVPPADMEADGHRQPLLLSPGAAPWGFSYRVRALHRGDARFGDAFVRAQGPLGICSRQWRVPLAQPVRVYPDLEALGRGALEHARRDAAEARRVQRRPADGREFESLRDYREGDDFRAIDWKATARRARTMVRAYEPERSQPAILLLDCGRHMTGLVGGRRKLDLAVDAALRLAKVCLNRGDWVGLVAFASDLKAHLPPRKGRDHLKALTAALYRVEAALEESDYGMALDRALALHHKRSLLVVFTDLLDPAGSDVLLRRSLALVPRHLPLVVSLLDEGLERSATQMPTTVQAAYERQTAGRLQAEYALTTQRLQDGGGLALRAAPSAFAAATVNEYLRVKARGLL